MARDDFPKPPPVWILALMAWVAIGLAFTPTLQAALDDNGLALEIATFVLFFGLYAAGIAAFLVPRPWGTVVVRLGAFIYVCAGVFVGIVADASIVERALAPVVAVVALGAALTVPVGERFIDGASYPGERRFGFRWPREALGGIAIAIVVPVLCVAALLAAVGAPGLWRWVAIAAVLVLAPASWLLVRQLLVLAFRWLVFAPRAVVAVDPYLLGDPMRIPAARVLDLTAVPGDVATRALLDLRAGYKGEWVQMVFDGALETPPPRALPEAIARTRPPLPKEVVGVAWPVTSPGRAVASARVLHLPVGAEALEAEAALRELLKKGEKRTRLEIDTTRVRSYEDPESDDSGA